MPLADPQVGDADQKPNTDRHVPTSLTSALDALEADTELRAFFEPDIIEVYVGLKRKEWARWAAAVTDWEQDKYARVY